MPPPAHLLLLTAVRSALQLSIPGIIVIRKQLQIPSEAISKFSIPYKRPFIQVGVCHGQERYWVMSESGSLEVVEGGSEGGQGALQGRFVARSLEGLVAEML